MKEDYSKLSQIEEGVAVAANLNDSVPIVEAKASLRTGDVDEKPQPQASTKQKASPLQVQRGLLEIDSPPPPGVRPGGVWGTSTHYGEHTKISSVLCCLIGGCIPVCIHCCIPFDKHRVYKVGRKYYDTKGTVIVTPSDWVEGELDYPIDRDRRQQAYIFSGMIIFFLLLLSIVRCYV